jgi:hypothetical protein
MNTKRSILAIFSAVVLLACGSNPEDCTNADARTPTAKAEFVPGDKSICKCPAVPNKDSVCCTACEGVNRRCEDAAGFTKTCEEWNGTTGTGGGGTDPPEGCASIDSGNRVISVDALNAEMIFSLYSVFSVKFSWNWVNQHSVPAKSTEELQNAGYYDSGRMPELNAVRFSTGLEVSAEVEWDAIESCEQAADDETMALEGDGTWDASFKNIPGTEDVHRNFIL